MSSENKNTQLHVEENEKHLLLDHDYDGIQELNHPLPRWWNVIFYATVLFGIGYWTYYTFLNGPTLRDRFKKEYAQVKVLQEEYKKLTAAFNPDKYAKFNTPENKDKALEVFTANCVQCHAEGGRGDVGPNLTDNYWLVAKGTPETIYNTVYNGSEANGMPAWGEVLPSDDIYLAVTYVMSLHNTFNPKGKEPQGEKIEN